MTKLTVYLKPYYFRMFVGFIIKFIGTIMDLFIPWILSHLIDEVAPTGNIPSILRWGLLMIACSVAAWQGNIIANRMASSVSANVTRKLRHDLFEKIAYLSCRNVDRFTVPSVISRLTSDTYNVHQMLGMIQRLGIRAPILLIGGVVLTIFLDFGMSMTLVAVLPFVTIAVFAITKKGIPLFTNLQKAVDVLVRTVRENITGIRVIKALSKTDYEKQRFDTVNEDVVAREKEAGVNMAKTNPLMSLFLNLGLVAVILVGAYEVNKGVSEPGKIIAFLSYFTIILNAMLMITRIFVTLSKGTASFKRIAEVLDAPEDIVIAEPDVIPTDDHITFDHVSFSYNKKQNNVNDISFSLKKGETLGIIGATGSGKSTIIKLLMRFYDVDSGCIRINGRNINSIPSEELHAKFGVVLQNDALFADTICENIDFGRGIDRENIQRATVLAQADEFIKAVDGGLDYKLTIKGANLSGGQKQRVLISRAFAGNPEILILDDASSALDYKTDAKLRQALSEHFKNTTKIIVAQRISSIKHADKILVLDEGNVIGFGTHDELIKICDVYAEISKTQLGG